MSLILNIDTATGIAHVSIAENGDILHELTNIRQKDHAAFVQPAINAVLQEAEISPKQLDAVSVIIGPGSYTGIRVGLASAKGICYGSGLPLIGINTLESLAFSVILNKDLDAETLIAPMIDARRSEVFTAIYDVNLNVILEPCNKILDNLSFGTLLADKKIVFTGDGAPKMEKICNNENASFFYNMNNIRALGILSNRAFEKKGFIDIAYSEPLYLKEFHSVSVSNDGKKIFNV